MSRFFRPLLAALGLVAATAASASTLTAWDFTFISIDGQSLPMSQFQGKAVLVVNTASQCGFTPQYKGLEELQRIYGPRGLVILGVPSNDFGAQEPGDSKEIKQFCESNFGIDFPLTEKVKVIGEDAHPFYRWAAQQLGPLAVPRWNFHKYLVAPDGRLVDWFSSVTAPDALRLRKAIEAVLPK
ncbi:MAG TPA: glutathione peroxidase [Rhodospirillaceae bacterium]|nr:glutathione peroxidase [Rhodospirillaceae bacterium]